MGGTFEVTGFGKSCSGHGNCSRSPLLPGQLQDGERAGEESAKIILGPDGLCHMVLFLKAPQAALLLNSLRQVTDWRRLTDSSIILCPEMADKHFLVVKV